MFWQPSCKSWQFVAVWQKQERDAQDYLWGVHQDLDVQVSKEEKRVVFWMLVEPQRSQVRGVADAEPHELHAFWESLYRLTPD